MPQDREARFEGCSAPGRPPDNSKSRRGDVALADEAGFDLEDATNNRLADRAGLHVAVEVPVEVRGLFCGAQLEALPRGGEDRVAGGEGRIVEELAAPAAERVPPGRLVRRRREHARRAEHRAE